MTRTRGGGPQQDLIDISIPYSSTIEVWPGDVPYSCGWTARREDGSSVNLGAITTSTHAGTHADAPLHVESAWGASESLDVSLFVGQCTVIVLPESTSADSIVGVEQLQALLPGGAPTRLLLCSRHSVASGEFPAGWPVLDAPAADWLISHNVQLFGTDAPSVDARESKSLPIHHRLFDSGARVLENLSLSHVAAGDYELLAQPLSIVGADAAPVRALLRKL